MARKETASSYARKLVRAFEEALEDKQDSRFDQSMISPDDATEMVKQTKHKLQKYIGDLQEEIQTLKGR